MQSFPQIERSGIGRSKLWQYRVSQGVQTVSGMEQLDCSGRWELVVNELGCLGLWKTKPNSNWIKPRKNVLSHITRSPEAELESRNSRSQVQFLDSFSCLCPSLCRLCSQASFPHGIWVAASSIWDSSHPARWREKTLSPTHGMKAFSFTLIEPAKITWSLLDQ